MLTFLLFTSFLLSSAEECVTDPKLQELVDFHQIEQLLLGLGYNVDDAAIGLKGLSDIKSFMEANLHPNFTSVMDTANRPNMTLDKNGFIAQISQLIEGGFYQGYHYGIQSGLYYVQKNETYAKLRVNRINVSSQKDFKSQKCKQDFTLEVSFFEVVKENNKWKFLSLFLPVAHEPLPPGMVTECVQVE